MVDSKKIILIGNPATQVSNFSELHSVEIEFEGKTMHIKVEKDVSILDLLLNQGFSPDYSCKSGICMACMTIVEEGCVYQENQDPLSAEHLKDKKALLCQAKPASSKIKLKRAG